MGPREEDRTDQQQARNWPHHRERGAAEEDALASITKWYSVPTSITVRNQLACSRVGVTPPEGICSGSKHHHQQQPELAIETREGAQGRSPAEVAAKQIQHRTGCKQRRRPGQRHPQPAAHPSIKESSGAEHHQAHRHIAGHDLDGCHRHSTSRCSICPVALSDRAAPVSR